MDICCFLHYIIDMCESIDVISIGAIVNIAVTSEHRRVVVSIGEKHKKKREFSQNEGIQKS
jgi:hypothetical protein